MTNETRKEKSNLGRIINMVTSTTDDFTEVFIATEEGEFGRFTIPSKSSRESGRCLGFYKLNLKQYLRQTQHYIGDKRLDADYGSTDTRAR
jgi:hypothetical protein